MDCSDPVQILLSVPYEYTVEMAYKNYDILNTPTARSINTGRLNLFMQNINDRISDCVFITTFGIDGPASTSILKYDGSVITYAYDISRFSHIKGDIYTNVITYLFTETIQNDDNLIVTSYHAITPDNKDFVVYRDIVFTKVRRIY
jgi:hypothetical protein